jgi:phage terminase Nu1 subunit (DNA packaging protein)
MATVSEAAQHIFVGRRRFFELLDDGVIERKSQEDGYNLDEVRRSYILHVRQVAAGRGADSDVDLSSVRAQLTQAQTEAVLLKNSVARGEYVAVEEVVRQVQNDYAVVRQRLLSIAGKISDELAHRDREIVHSVIDREINAALEELSAPAELAARAGETE